MEKAKIRLFVEGSLRAGEPIALAGAQAHYLSRVMRLPVGARVRLFNARDGEWQARIAAFERALCRLVVEQQRIAPRPEPGPWLAFAPVKKEATDFIIGKATELGAAAILPVFTRYTQTQRLNRERLVANVVEAAEQCGRLTIPAIGEAVTLAALIAGWEAGRSLIVFDRERGGALQPAVAATAADSARPPCLLIGPEGGWAPDELDALQALPFVRTVTLGPRTLRADTAGVAALAAWQVLTGEW